MIGDNTTLLDNGHQVMGSLHVVDRRSQTQALSVLLLFTWDTRVQLIICSEMLNQLQNWIMREPLLL